MIQDIYDKLLKLFVDKDIDCEIRYDDHGDKYVILESLKKNIYYFIIQLMVILLVMLIFI